VRERVISQLRPGNDLQAEQMSGGFGSRKDLKIFREHRPEGAG